MKKKKRIRRSVLRSRLINGWIERRIEDIRSFDRMIEDRRSVNNAEHCIVCGEIIPEGRQICKDCEIKY